VSALVWGDRDPGPDPRKRWHAAVTAALGPVFALADAAGGTPRPGAAVPTPKPPPHLHRNDRRLLQKLAEHAEPVQIKPLTARLGKRDRSGVGKRVRGLEGAGLIHRPDGPRSGVTLTDLGRAAAGAAPVAPR